MLSQRQPCYSAHHATASHHGQNSIHRNSFRKNFGTPQHASVKRNLRGNFRHFGYYTEPGNAIKHEDHSSATVQQTSVGSAPYSENLFQIYYLPSVLSLPDQLQTPIFAVHFSTRIDKYIIPCFQVSLRHKQATDKFKFKPILFSAFSVFWSQTTSSQHLSCSNRLPIQVYLQQSYQYGSSSGFHQLSLILNSITMAPAISKLSPSTTSANRFAALMTDATHPPSSIPPSPSVPHPPVVSPTTTVNNLDNDTDEGPWLMPPLKRNATNRKKEKQRNKPAIQIPKNIPSPANGEKTIPSPYEMNKFAFDCRIKVQPGESVNPSRLLQAVLTVFQKAQPKTVLSTSMYDNQDCPMVVDPKMIPTSEAKLTPFISSWKKLKEDMFLCRAHMISASPLEQLKKDPQVIDYLKQEYIVVEKAILESADHVLVGFLVNVVPDPDSLSAQQYRFEKLLPHVPGFQLVTRKLTFKENSKLWCTVLKIRVDRADGDELTLAFQAASVQSKDFQYYAFDQYTGLHPDQKRYIIETQKNFLVQNRSIVIDWPINDSPNFVMWLEDEDDLNVNEYEEPVPAAKTAMTKPSDMEMMDTGSNSTKRPREDVDNLPTQTGNDEQEGSSKTTKRRVNQPKIFNNVDLTKVGIDEFLYSYNSGDGAPLIRYIYPVADGRRELLVSRYKRAEVNSFIKVIFRELIRHMSDSSKLIAFDNPDELSQEAAFSSAWSPSGMHTMVPFSTTSTSSNLSNKMSNKRRAKMLSGTSTEQNIQGSSTPSSIHTMTGTDTSSSSLTNGSTPNSSVIQALSATYSVPQQTEMNTLKEQLSLLQKQHTQLYENVKQISAQRKEDTKEMQLAINSNRTQLQTYVDQALDQRVTDITNSVTEQYQESVVQIRREMQSLDQRQTEAQTRLRQELGTEIAAAIAQLTTVVAKIEVGQSNLIQKLSSSEPDSDQVMQDDQIALFLDNVTASGVTVDVVPNPQGLPDQSSISGNKSHIPGSLGSLPSTIGKVALTTLHGLNKKAGRGGGRDLRQQTLHQVSRSVPADIVEHSTSTRHPTSNIAAPNSTHNPSTASSLTQTGRMGNIHT